MFLVVFVCLFVCLFVCCCFFLCLFVCIYVYPSVINMKLLPAVCLWQGTIHSGGGGGGLEVIRITIQSQDPITQICRGVSRVKEQSINFGECLESLSHILVQGTIYHGLQTGRWSEAYDIS